VAGKMEDSLMKKIIFLVYCLSAANVCPMKRPRDNKSGDQNKRPQSRQRVAQNPGAQPAVAEAMAGRQNVTQNPIYSLPLEICWL